MYHPVRRINTLIEALRLTVSNFQRLGLALLTAIQKNTEALALQQATTEQTLKAVQATSAAVSYLAAAEQHRREQAGIRHEF
jgi:hypothetical protein